MVEIQPGMSLTDAISKEWHARGDHMYIVRDHITEQLLMASKLKILVSHINEQLARNAFERVSTRGLYESVGENHGSRGTYQKLHKQRYRVSRCDRNHANIILETSRACGTQRATLLTEVM